MIRLNLLPYRETRRAARLRQFAVLLGGVAILGLLVVMLGFTALDARLQIQSARNEYLKSEIAKLDKQISAIHELKKETQELLARKQVVESLQTDRSDAVHLLDQLVRLMPEGVFLKSIDQHGDVVHLQGYAQSSARVSSLMRNLDSSPWLSNATLIEVKSATIQGIQANEFSMDVHMNKPGAAPGDKESGKNGKVE